MKPSTTLPVLRNLDEISCLVALKLGWDEAKRTAILNNYINFLDNSMTPSGREKRPSLEVDSLWHEHILHTEIYSEFCLKRFGYYVHHIACVPPDVVDILSELIGRDLTAGANKNQSIYLLESDLANCGTPNTPPRGPDWDIYSAAGLANCGTPCPPTNLATGQSSLANCGPGGPPASS